MMLNDGTCGEWDSQLEADQSLQQMDSYELNRIKNKFEKEYN